MNDYGLVGFQPLDLTQEDTILNLIANADNCIQYGEHLEPKEEDYEASERFMNGNADINME